MNLTIEFDAQEEAWLDTQAKLHGLQPAEIVKGLVDERLPARKGQRSATEHAGQVIDAENQALMFLLRSWRAQDESDDQQELELRDAENREFLNSLSVNRLTLRNLDV